MGKQLTGISIHSILRHFGHVCFLVFLIPILINAQSQFSFEHFGAEDGLSHRWVHQIIQDKDGFLWLATSNGLNRFDGHHFQSYPILEEKYSITEILYLQESKNGLLWLKSNTFDTTILFNPYTHETHVAQMGKDYFIPYPSEKQTIYRNQATYLLELEQFLENENLGLDSIAVRNNAPNPLLAGIKEWGNDCVVTKKEEKELWIWYNLQLRGDKPKPILQHYARLDLKENKWSRYPIADFLNVTIANPFLPIDTEGRFWFPSHEKTTDQPFDYFKLPSDIPLKNWQGIKVDNRQNIWIYDQEFKLYRYDLKLRQLDFIAKFESTKIEAYEDTEGIYWVGSQNGLLKIERRKDLFENYMAQPFKMGEKPPIGNSMSYIGEIGENQFLTMANSKWYHIQLDTRTIIPFDIKDHSQLLYVSSNCLYFSLNDFLGIYSTKDRQFQKIKWPDKQTPFTGDLSHKVPFTFEGGKEIGFIDTLRKRVEWPVQAKSELTKNYYYWYRERQLLLADYGFGIVIVDLTDLSESTIPLFDHQVNKHVRAWIAQGDSLWMATLDGLKLFDLNTNQIVQHYTTEYGLPGNSIYSAIASGENIWLGTDNGLCRFNPKTLETRNFYVEDGLSHNEFNSRATLQMSNGKLWMGGLNGVNIFNPKELEKLETEVAPLVLTKFSKYNVEEDSTFISENLESLKNRTFHIQPEETSFSFQFFLRSLLQPSKHRYYWYLEGYEPPWSNISDEPLAMYRYVPPGNYILKIKATDSRGNPAANELAIPVHAIQIWYKRWWAWLLYAVLFGGVAFAFYRYNINRKLEQQEAMRLKELDSIKTKLYTNITHEFRTPLTVILGMAEQLAVQSPQLTAGKKEQQALEQKLASVSRNGQNLLSLVNQMLDLSKLEAGKLSLHLVQADMVNYVRYIASSFHSFAATKDVDLVFYSDLEKCLMDFDKDKMLNIVSNLLSNAIKFTPAGGEVLLNLRGNLKLPPKFTLTVKDTGIGIPAAQIPHIFDRFYQVDSSHTRKGEGTGIGLTLVKELVKLMNGEISVESEEGEGTVFTLVLPVTNNAPTATAGLDKSPLLGHAALSSQLTNPFPTYHKEDASGVSPSFGGGRGEAPILLVVEDNADVAQYIQSCLENEYQILYAADGQIGIEQAIEQVPDIIISDVMMPNKDGFELVQTLKNDERTSHIPIILLTAKADVASKIEGLESGADAYLAKPFNQQELRVRLEKLIELRKKLQARYSVHSLQSSVLSPQTSYQQPSANTDLEDQFLKKVHVAILEHLSDDAFSSVQLAKKMHLSESQLYRKLKALTDKSTAIYIRSVRLQKGLELLQTTEMNVSEVAYEVGFTNLSYFSRVFSEEFGISPNASRN